MSPVQICDLKDICPFHFSVAAPTSTAVNFSVQAVATSPKWPALVPDGPPQFFSGVTFGNFPDWNFAFKTLTEELPSMTFVTVPDTTNFEYIEVAFVVCVLHCVAPCLLNHVCFL
jgi:hypothetical protein